MNWLTNLVRPKIQALINKKSDLPDNLWTKCPKCEHMIFHRDLLENLSVCHHCQHHLRITVKQRLEILFDNKQFTLSSSPKSVFDPLKFKDTKKYADRLKDYKQKTGYADALVVAYGQIEEQSAVIAAFNFDFMGGSMGTNVGDSFLAAAELAIKTKSPLITITASGGARMQEGILSLMQMPRTIIAVEKVKEMGLPYITLLTDPTTGGVSASFAMLGDFAIAEPGAIIGFAGARVIEETIRQKLPDCFQKAEFLLDHGMIDMVVPRKSLKETLGKLLSLLSHTRSNSLINTIG